MSVQTDDSIEVDSRKAAYSTIPFPEKRISTTENLIIRFKKKKLELDCGT